MFSPPNTPAVSDWFRRLDAAWKRMPAEEQTRQLEEVQQHLEGLVAAKVAQAQTNEDAWNAALGQFGDPTQIGRKMYQEWRQSKTGFRADMAAILFGIGCQALLMLAERPLAYFGLINSADGSHLSTVGMIIHFGGYIFVYAAIGHKYPLQAIKGAFYAYLLFMLSNWISVYTFFFAHVHHNTFLQPLSAYFVRMALWLPVWLTGYTTVAYLASVTKRGWYRPTREDFKVTLLSRRRQVG